jgi:hypothetical protein
VHYHGAILLVFASAIGCAARTPRAEACSPVPQAQWLGTLPVYRACSVDRAARPLGATPRVQYSPSGRVACFRATIDVVVDTLGRPVPSTATTIRSTDAGFLQALLTALEGRRYEPALRGGRVVPQIVRVDEVVERRVVIMPLDGPRPRLPRRPSC